MVCSVHTNDLFVMMKFVQILNYEDCVVELSSGLMFCLPDRRKR